MLPCGFSPPVKLRPTGDQEAAEKLLHGAKKSLQARKRKPIFNGLRNEYTRALPQNRPSQSISAAWLAVAEVGHGCIGEGEQRFFVLAQFLNPVLNAFLSSGR